MPTFVNCTMKETMKFDNEMTGCRLEYNTGMKRMALPEYGRSVEKMVEHIKTIEDRAKRTEQAFAVIKVMELLNPQVHLQDDWEHKLWDHLYVISGYDLDIDSPYPMPSPEEHATRPEPIPLNTKPVRATHYGRNIESILDLIAGIEDGQTKEYVIRNLAIYMRQQYMNWNKTTISEETVFSDIEKLSDGRVKVPEGMQLGKAAPDGQAFRPLGNQQKKQGGKQFYHKQRKK